MATPAAFLLYGSLTITKNGIDDLDNHDDPNAETQTSIFNVAGTSAAGNVINIDVVIVGNSSVTITDLPVGTYTVKEKVEWSWRYVLTGSNNREVEINGGQNTPITFENDRTNGKWLSGDSIAKNWWGDGLKEITNSKTAIVKQPTSAN